jgi:hypothetical protein
MNGEQTMVNSINHRTSSRYTPNWNEIIIDLCSLARHQGI